MPELPAVPNVEQALIGACLLSESATAASVEFLTADDFALDGNRAVYECILGLWRSGAPSNPVTVAERLHRDADELEGLTRSARTDLQTVQYLAKLLIDTAAARRLALYAESLSLEACSTADPYALAVTARDHLGRIASPLGSVPDDVFDADDLVKLADEKPTPWVLPGLLREGWRALIVAFEGRGKSVLLTQLATGLAYGVQTLTARDCDPASALLVDLENPREEVAKRVKAVSGACNRPRAARLSVWTRPAGLNLRSRRDRAELEAVLRDVRPSLVCMGPLYKAYRVEGRERDEEAAVQTQAVLDDLRSRFGFALLMEHHAPHKEGGSRREVRPFGSSAWLRWPELGYGWEDAKDRKGSLVRSKFRGDRVRASWPDRLDRGRVFPWDGYWPEGIA